MLRKTVLSLKSPTGAFIAPLRCANANLFNKVQEKLAKNKKAPARHKAEESYLLTTKLYCGKCGALMFGESGVSHTGKMYTYYQGLRLFGCVKAILILHDTRKNAILGKLKLTMAYFRQIQEIAKEDGTQTAGILYHCM